MPIAVTSTHLRYSARDSIVDRGYANAWQQFAQLPDCRTCPASNSIGICVIYSRPAPAISTRTTTTRVVHVLHWCETSVQRFAQIAYTQTFTSPGVALLWHWRLIATRVAMSCYLLSIYIRVVLTATFWTHCSRDIDDHRCWTTLLTAIRTNRQMPEMCFVRRRLPVVSASCYIRDAPTESPYNLCPRYSYPMRLCDLTTTIRTHANSPGVATYGSCFTFVVDLHSWQRQHEMPTWVWMLFFF